MPLSSYCDAPRLVELSFRLRPRIFVTACGAKITSFGGSGEVGIRRISGWPMYEGSTTHGRVAKYPLLLLQSRKSSGRGSSSNSCRARQRLQKLRPYGTNQNAPPPLTKRDGSELSTLLYSPSGLVDNASNMTENGATVGGEQFLRSTRTLPHVQLSAHPHLLGSMYFLDRLRGSSSSRSSSVLSLSCSPLTAVVERVLRKVMALYSANSSTWLGRSVTGATPSRSRGQAYRNYRNSPFMNLVDYMDTDPDFALSIKPLSHKCANSVKTKSQDLKNRSVCLNAVS
jgi:hypothetical protein